jgi:hypothetical protein
MLIPVVGRASCDTLAMETCLVQSRTYVRTEYVLWQMPVTLIFSKTYNDRSYMKNSRGMDS